jgi:hypothetical protein
MALELTARPVGDKIEIAIKDDSHGTITLHLDRYMAFAYLESVASALSKLPSDPTAPLHLQQPVLRAKHPSFQVGLRGNGDITLSIRPDPLPPFEFDFDVSKASQLIEGLRAALTTVAGSSSRN